MSTYPRDEFDAVPESPRRQGVHRTRSTEPRRGLAWIMAAGVAALMIGAAAFFLMPRLADTSSASGASVPSSATAEATPSADATPSAAPTSPAASPSAAAAGTPSATAEPTSAPTASAAPAGVNRALEVGVYNSTGTAGLAGRVGDRAKAAGWAVTSVGNWSGSPMNTSVVFYRDAASAASAQALAADLGIPTVLEAPGLGLPLAAVVGPGYAG